MITLGTDPEVFVADENGLTTGCGKIGGTKLCPLALPKEGYFIQEDNVMAEFNTPPVAVQGTEGSYEFGRTVVRGRRIVEEHLLERGLTALWGTSRVEFDLVTLQAGGSKALEFGCSPDFDAYNNGAAAPRIDPAEIGNVRYAGGHLHVGYTLPYKLPPFVVASLMDATVGLWSIVNSDKQGDRRLRYGAPGRFRPTEYGLEYRTLSNFWVASGDLSESLAFETWELFSRLERCKLADVKRLFAEIPWADVQRIITEEDRPMALSLRNYLIDQVWRTL